LEAYRWTAWNYNDQGVRTLHIKNKQANKQKIATTTPSKNKQIKHIKKNKKT